MHVCCTCVPVSACESVLLCERRPSGALRYTGWSLSPLISNCTLIDTVCPVGHNKEQHNKISSAAAHVFRNSESVAVAREISLATKPLRKNTPENMAWRIFALLLPGQVCSSKLKLDVPRQLLSQVWSFDETGIVFLYFIPSEPDIHKSGE